MMRRAAVFTAFLLLEAPAAGTPALADDLVLTPGKVFTDAAGAYVTVSVKNAGAQIAPETYVSCAFFNGKKALGKSATTLFSIVPGLTGTDQVRLLGATGANRAECAITGQK